MMKGSNKKKISVTLDKLEQDYLKTLKEHTGKSAQEIIKLALFVLHQNICEQKAPANTQPTQGSITIKTEPIVIRTEPSWPYPVTYPQPQLPQPQLPQQEWYTITCSNASFSGSVQASEVIDFNNGFSFSDSDLSS